jgi:hypothetical protein
MEHTATVVLWVQDALNCRRIVLAS